MRSERINVAGVDVIALRVSFTGDLGWELHCPAHDQLRLYEALLVAGEPYGAGPVGARALSSLRIEKGYGSWSREFSPELWPHEVGMKSLCKMDKELLNRDAAHAVMQRPVRESLVLLALDEADTTVSNADASGGEPVFCGEECVGYVTSGAFGYSVGMSLALGFVKTVRANDIVHVMVLGKPHRATVLAQPPFDPGGLRLRA